MPERMPTEEEWQEWLHHPCTKRLRFWAAQTREELRNLWEDGTFSASFETEMIVKNAGATGACSVLKDLVDPDYEKIVIGASDEAKQVGPGTAGPSSPG